MAKVLVTGGCGIAGRVVARHLLAAGHAVRLADMAAAPADWTGDFVRCDTRSPGDVDDAVRGCDAVVHLAAWHCGHLPPVSDETIFAVNVDGTFHVFEACRRHRVATVAFASSMAYGHGSVYSVTKVVGEDLGRCLHERTGIPVALLRYHDFVPKPYLAFGAKLLRNGVDAEDVAAATVRSVEAGLDKRFGCFRTIVHTAHGLPEAVRSDFSTLGPAWCESVVPGSAALLDRFGIDLPRDVEQHDLADAVRTLGWTPRVGFATFLQDLARRVDLGESVESLWAPGSLTEVRAQP